MSLDRLPTLTEVVELGREQRPAPLPVALASNEPVALAPAGAAPGPDIEALVSLVLARLEPRLGAVLQARLSDALAPALAQAADGLIRASRLELAQTLRALVEEAVVQAQRDQDRA